MIYDNRITKKIKKYLKENDIIESPFITLNLQILDSAISDYLTADEDIKKNGIVITQNKGATIGANPAVKIKLDSAKLIIKILKDLGIDNEDADAEAFLKSLISE